MDRIYLPSLIPFIENLPSISVVVPATRELSFDASILTDASRSGSLESRSLTRPVMLAADIAHEDVRARKIISRIVRRLERVVADFFVEFGLVVSVLYSYSILTAKILKSLKVRRRFSTYGAVSPINGQERSVC